MILTTATNRVERRIDNSRDALEFAQAYATHPENLCDLVNATIEGDGADMVREALANHVMALGNSSYDQLVGILNIIRNSSWIATAPHINTTKPYNVPAIAIASGPSVASYIDEIRNLQRSCLIVCADTAVRGLLEHGIYPHVATPIERHPALVNHVHGGDDIVYAGSIFTPASIPRLFGKHLVCPPDESLGKWVDHDSFSYGGSTGTAAVAVSLKLTTGPVYLVGHDLSMTGDQHWSAATSMSEDRDALILGNNGELLQSTRWYKMFRDHISLMALETQRVFDTNIIHLRGAKIDGAQPCTLPMPGPAFDFRMTGTLPNSWRLHLPHRIERLPSDLREAELRVDRAATMEHLEAEVLCGADNRDVICALFRPIYIQFSMEKRMGRPPEQIFAAVKEAMLHVLARAIPAVTEAI